MQDLKRNKSLLKRKILEYLSKLGISKYEFYKNSGISRGTLDNTSGLTEENIFKFLQYAPNISLEWLLLDQGEMLKCITENSDNKDDQSGIVSEPGPPLYATQVSVYHVRGANAITSLFEGGAATPEDYMRIPGLENCSGALYLTSDAMHPLLKSGDLVAYTILKDKRSILWGEMYLLTVQIESETVVMIGHVHQSAKGEEYISVHSHNPQYEPREIGLAQITAFAHVRASVRIS